MFDSYYVSVNINALLYIIQLHNLALFGWLIDLSHLFQSWEDLC